MGHHPPQIGAIDLVDSAEQVNHRIETVNAGRAHCAGRPLLWTRTPVLLRHEEAGRRGLRGCAVAGYAEPAILEARLELDHRRMEAPGIGDREHYAGPRRRVERRFGALHVERKRLFDKDVLAGRRGLLDLRAVLTVWRREDDSVDCRIAQNPFDSIFQPDTVLGAKALRRAASAGVAGYKADRRALALNRGDERAAPPADADDSGADHVFAASMSLTPRNAR